MPGADRPGVAVPEGVDIDRLPVRRLRRPLPALQKALRDPPRLRLERRRERLETERRLAGDGFVHAPERERPVVPRDGKVTPEVQRRLLADPVALPPALDRAVGETGLPARRGACPGPADEHAPGPPENRSRRKGVM